MELVLLVGGLATWRLSHMIVKENGPLMLLARTRAALAALQTRSGGLFDLISCVYCVSVWIGLIAALWVSGDIFHKFGYGLAFSAIATIIEMLLNKLDALTVIARPTTNNKISIGARSTPK